MLEVLMLFTKVTPLSLWVKVPLLDQSPSIDIFEPRVKVPKIFRSLNIGSVVAVNVAFPFIVTE